MSGPASIAQERAIVKAGVAGAEGEIRRLLYTVDSTFY